ncbi:MAG TPA: cytochrome c biogenesis protein ResB [Phycisphaerae bacterium]|nr:cytochrome c biogenesis protein ResB [Phycisphaerae bacterium]
MSTLRRILLWGGLACIAALIILSITGAFLGAERAEELFSSAPLAACWVLLATVAAAAVVSFRRLLRSPGLLGMHLGWALVIVGGLAGSPAGHRLAAGMGGGPKVHHGYLAVGQAGASDEVMDEQMRLTLGRLPFEIELKSFRPEYYPVEPERWQFGYNVAPGKGPPAEGKIDWQLNKPVEIPHTDTCLRVIEIDQNPPQVTPAMLCVTTPAGEVHLMPGAVGSEFLLKSSGARLKIKKVFKNIKIVEDQGRRHAVDAPREGDDPAAELEVRLADGRVLQHYAFTPELTGPEEWGDGLDIVYLRPRLAYEYRPLRVAAMLQLTRGKNTHLGVLVVRQGEHHGELPLRHLYPDSEAWKADGAPRIFLAGPPQQVKSYKADVAVIEDGREAARKVIEINKPLHYGGYHVYYDDVEQEEWNSVRLFVRSDSYLRVAYAGLFLLCAGAFWHFWLAPAVRFARSAWKWRSS